MHAEKFSRYEIREALGHGGMATVYRAYDPLFEREVALKILKQELLNDLHVRERFERETKIIAKLEHAAIVPVYDVRRDNEQLFFVMRYMAGGSLSERIQNGSLSLSNVAGIIQRLATALDYAHYKGVIHRDLKPGNILFDEYSNAYISDFGIAKLAQASTELSNSGIIGTPTHMSPEQARGEEVDGRSDIYSLGVMLFEMLSGQTPFQATTPLGMALKHATEPAPHILDINPNLPAGVEAVIKKVLAKKREQRYDSGTEFANAFIATLDGSLISGADLLKPILSPAHKNGQALTAASSIPATVPNRQPGSRFSWTWIWNAVRKFSR
jgi:serine/threonine protein kinase